MAGNPPKHYKRIRLGNYPAISVVIGITLALFILGAFGVIVVHANKFSEIVREDVEIQVFLLKTTTENQRNKIKQEIISKNYVAGEVNFMSKEEAAQEFIEETGEDFFSILENNPLHDALLVNIKPEFVESNKMKRIRSELEALNGVFEVHYVDSLVEDINSNIQKAGLILILLFVAFLITAIILINNTIKLALFSQRFLIRTMQLVGANAAFIQRPFLIRASIHGFLSALIAIIALSGMLYFAYNEIEDLKILYDREKLGIIFAGLMIIGVIIGFASSYKAISKYLKMSLDELY